jgi:hypothetical protein
VRAALLLAWLPVGFAATADGLAPAYADHIGAHGGSAVGLMFAAYAAGTVAGEVVLTRLATTTKDRLMLPLATGCQLALVCFALRPGLPAALGLLILMGIGTAYAQPLDRQLLSATPEAMRGRVLTLHSAGLMFTQGAFIAAAGAAAEGVEPWAVLTAAGVLGVLTVSILGGTLRRNGAAARG